jgi:hypothetical protein
MEAVMRGDYGTDDSLRAQLKKAHELKISCMQELKKHIVGHGC